MGGSGRMWAHVGAGGCQQVGARWMLWSGTEATLKVSMSKIVSKYRASGRLVVWSSSSVATSRQQASAVKFVPSLPLREARNPWLMSPPVCTYTSSTMCTYCLSTGRDRHSRLTRVNIARHTMSPSFHFYCTWHEKKTGTSSSNSNFAFCVPL